MTITRRQFDLGINDNIHGWMREAYRLLAEHRDQAFSEAEIQGRAQANPLSWEDLKVALETLVKLNAIQSRMVKNTPYFAYWHDMDTDNWEQNPESQI